MNTTRYLLVLLRALIVLMWTPALVLAGVVAQGARPLMFDMEILMFSAFLSTMAGATALAIRVNNLLMHEQAQALTESREPRPLVRPWLFVIAHMLGSWTAGTFGYVLGQAQDLSVWWLLLAVLSMSFGGAKALEIGAERYLAVLRTGGKAA